MTALASASQNSTTTLRRSVHQRSLPYSLMDVSDMPAVVGEAARVLRPGRHLCVSVTHPMSDAGSLAGQQPEAPFTIPGTYLGRRRFEGTFERDGLQMTFHGWSYPLEVWS